MNKFPISDENFNTLHALKLPDKRKYIFNAPKLTGEARTPHVCLTPLGKHAAKKDKLAIRQYKAHGIKIAGHLTWHCRNAGIISRNFGKI